MLKASIKRCLLILSLYQDETNFIKWHINMHSLGGLMIILFALHVSARYTEYVFTTVKITCEKSTF